ncbi:MAG: MFS transporter [Myxococcota bacterium]|nr:MFS transporter [Myxococcota bacterium]
MTTEAPGRIERAAVAEPEFTRGYTRYALALLLLVYIFNFIDRQVLAILLEDIKLDLGASDTEMGFLSGLAFALFYTIAGIPIARWADRGSRRTIIAVGLTLWSAMTVACGFTRSFVQLALARVGVGIGEAAGTPPSHSLISDYFPPERRATAMSIYATGIYFGAMIAYLAGGYLKELFDWRTAFLIVGVPGIPLALLVRLTLREPTRGYWERDRTHSEATPFGDVVRLLFGQRTFVWLLIAASCQSLSGYGFLAWSPTFLIRVHQMGGIEIGIWLGFTIGIAGALGAYLGGLIGDRFGERDERAYLYLAAIVSLASLPFAAVFLFESDRVWALSAFVPFYLLGAMYVGPLWSLVQGLVHVRMRATASAILLFILNLVGLGAGPLVVGFLNDQLAPRFGDEAIRYSLMVVAAIGGAATLFFWIASRSLRDDLRALRD